MKFLAINSAFTESNLVYYNGKKLNCQTLDSSLRHSENLLPAVEKLLGEDKIGSLNYIAIVVGPGSFTGIRIGIAMAKAFMTACPNIKAVTINSLELLAQGFIKNNKPTQSFWCVLNALSGNYFTAKFEQNGQCLEQPFMANGVKLEEITSQNVVSLSSENLEFANHSINFDCQTLYDVSKAKIDSGEFVSESQLLPLYLRLSQAEQELKDREVHIRNAVKDDLEEIFQISKVEFGKNSWTKSQFEQEFKQDNRIFLVAEIGNNVVGYMTAMQVNTEMEILDIAVKSTHKRQHIASSLMENLFQTKKGSITKCYLEVAEDNEPAKIFYKKLNFTVIGRRKSYYNNGETAIVMEKECK